jgi:amidase
MQLSQRQVSVREIVQWYLARVEALSVNGRALNAIASLSERAIDDANAAAGLDDPGYLSGRERDVQLSRHAGIDAAMSAGEADALLLPMHAGAKCTGKAGTPVLALPVGADASGAPFGITIVTPRGTDRRLLSMAIAIEAVIGERLIPKM